MKSVSNVQFDVVHTNTKLSRGNAVYLVLLADTGGKAHGCSEMSRPCQAFHYLFIFSPEICNPSRSEHMLRTQNNMWQNKRNILYGFAGGRHRARGQSFRVYIENKTV